MMSWPTREIMQIVMPKCKEWWGLPNVNGAIDKTHINIAKFTLYPKDYFYHKASGSIGNYSQKLLTLKLSKMLFYNVEM